MNFFSHVFNLKCKSFRNSNIMSQSFALFCVKTIGLPMNFHYHIFLNFSLMKNVDTCNFDANSQSNIVSIFIFIENKIFSIFRISEG